MGSPYSTFAGVPFDWQTKQPQRVTRAGVDYYSGSIWVYSQDAMDALWALRAIVAVVPVGDGAQRVYVDSWQPVSSIQHTLDMLIVRDAQGNQTDAGESHVAILTELSRDERLLRSATAVNQPWGVLLNVKVEFLLLS